MTFVKADLKYTGLPERECSDRGARQREKNGIIFRKGKIER